MARHPSKDSDTFFDEYARANTNSLWGAVIAATLARLGLRYAVISPGFRSAPLAFAFSRHPGIEAIPVLDERSAAFFALGLARQTGRATALICTSGTAAANFFPAIIEARESGTPLLALTADRPPELRHCNSGQAIDQLKLYGGYPNFQAELSMPSMDNMRLRYLRQTLVHAWERTRFPAAGPVHLNIPFRDPLTPTSNIEHPDTEIPFDPETFFSGVAPLPEVSVSLHETRGRILAKEMSSYRKGVIVVGPSQPEHAENFAKAVALISRRLGWPVLADGLNPLRNYAALLPGLISRYDILLRDTERAKQLTPDAILSIGTPPISNVLRAWLERSNARAWLLEAGQDNIDPLHLRSVPLRIDVEALAEVLDVKSRKAGSYYNHWLEADKQAGIFLNRELRRCDFNFEGKVSWLLSKSLPRTTPLFIASSMPVRDIEFFWQPGDRAIRTFFNRGANGIDGTLSTALGVAHKNKSAVLLTGDLALLHDTNGFLLCDKFRGHLSIVVINNRGGGIFEHLPIARFDPPFEEFFAMPQKVDFKKLATVYGVEYVRIKNLKELAPLMGKLPRSGIRIIEVPTDRKRDTRYRKALFKVKFLNKI